jgi:pilin isopeptide linkage protein
MVLDYTTENVGTTFYYVVREKNAGQTIDNVTFSDAVYFVTVSVLDDEVGGIRTETTITDGTNHVSSLDFENIFTPDPEDTTLEIRVEKTVKNTGVQMMGPEGFQFLLENMTLGGTRTAITDAEGLAVFTLTFTKEDIGNTYTYQLSEINDGRDNVEYSEAVYTITVSIERNDDNELTAAITNNGTETAEPVAQFENVYDPPKDDDNPGMGDTGLSLWIAMMAVSCGGAITLAARGSKQEEDEE